MLIKENKLLIYAIVVVIFISLTFAMTFPLFVKINSAISGFGSTDEPSLWYFWWLKFARIQHLDHRNCQFLAYPFGQDYGIFDMLYPLWSAFKRLTAITTNPFFAYNIENVLSFVLSGFFVYLLLNYICGNFLVALFSGVIYAFCPYHFARSWQHIGLVHIQWMPLYLYALFRLLKERTVWSLLFVLLSLFLAASFDFYYLYFTLIISAVFVIYCLFADFKNNRITALLVITAVTGVLLFLAFLIWPVIKMSLFSAKGSSSSVWSYNRPFEDLFSQSARPLSYFLPSTEHPLFGGFTSNFIGSGIYGTSFTEHALYLGWIPLVLAFLAVKRWLREKGEQAKTKEHSYLGFFLILAIVAWLFSQPPWWNLLGLKIYMPSFFMYKLLPMFRAYCRFGIVLMLAVAVLAGFGLKCILERLKTQKAKITVAVLFCALVLFEFWNYPPFKIVEFKVPQVYYWLKTEPGDFAIAEYPLDVNGPNEFYKFYQTKHEKKIINGTVPGTYSNKVSMSIIKLSSEHTAGVLKQLGVRYVLVHKDDYLGTELAQDKEEMSGIAKNKGLKLLRSFPAESCAPGDARCTSGISAVDVYEVVAQPVKFEVQEK